MYVRTHTKLPVTVSSRNKEKLGVLEEMNSDELGGPLTALEYYWLAKRNRANGPSVSPKTTIAFFLG